MTEKDFINLGAHLEALGPLIEEFCQKYDFKRIVGASVGRYPRIRLQRADEITVWLDLWMGFDAEGQRFSSFFQDIPYELSAGAFFDEDFQKSEKWRYQKSFVIWPAKPFTEIPDELIEALESGLMKMQKWDSAYLKNEGLPVQLA